MNVKLKVGSLGELVKQERIHQGLTQAECAMRAGFGQQAVWSRYERTASKSIHLDSAVALAKALGKDLTFFSALFAEPVKGTSK